MPVLTPEQRKAFLKKVAETYPNGEPTSEQVAAKAVRLRKRMREIDDAHLRGLSRIFQRRYW